MAIQNNPKRSEEKGLKARRQRAVRRNIGENRKDVISGAIREGQVPRFKNPPPPPPKNEK